MKVEYNSEIEEALTTIGQNIVNSRFIWRYLESYELEMIDAKKEKKIVNLYNNIGVNIESIKYDANEILENPYYKNIQLKNINYKNIKCTIKTLKARQCLNMSYSKMSNMFLQEYVDIGYLDKNVDIPVLHENKDIWMSPTIAEQRSMQNDIDKAHGNVLTFGLGLGYYPYMCLLKDNVESVTIVEINEDIIGLFKELILPQFKTDKKIEIIYGNMYDFYNKEFLSKFDYIFVDVWQSNDDGLEHHMKLMNTGIRQDNIGYWMEDSIIQPIKHLIALYFKCIATGTLTEAFRKSESENFKDLKRIHKYFRGINENITSVDRLLFYINDLTTIRNILSIKV